MELVSQQAKHKQRHCYGSDLKDASAVSNILHLSPVSRKI